MELQPKHKGEYAFTRWECAAAILCIMLLSSVAFAALANSREPGNRAVCANNMRRLGNAALMYSSEHSGLFPPRSLLSATNWWPTSLHPYYEDLKVLQCPSDAPRLLTGSQGTLLAGSYLFNSWNDYWDAKGVVLILATNELAMPAADIPQPGQTIFFGEKPSDAHAFHMDLFLGYFSYQVEERRHYPSRAKSGSSNYAFVDGSVRFLPPGASFIPLNLWAITDKWRTNSALFLDEP
jgi:prepilin-type processing-associated H-X9-DG protein